MKEFINLIGKETINKGIKALGQELIERADNITSDLEKVSSITIYANITPDEIANFDITKNYIACFENEIK